MIARWLSRWFVPDDAMSQTWLKAHERKTERVEYHGVSIQWPIRKIINESSPRMTAQRLRKRA